MDDPLSRPGPDKSFACPRLVACIIVTNVSRPDYLRWASINFSLRQRGRCRHPHALAQCSLARTGEMSIVKTSPVADFKSRRLKMMSVPERLTAVGRPDGINGRDRFSFCSFPKNKPGLQTVCRICSGSVLFWVGFAGGLRADWSGLCLPMQRVLNGVV